MKREKAVEPTTAWTWPETCPGDTMGSDRSCVSGAQLTVQTLEAQVKENVVKAGTKEKSAVERMIA